MIQGAQSESANMNFCILVDMRYVMRLSNRLAEFFHFFGYDDSDRISGAGGPHEVDYFRDLR